MSLADHVAPVRQLGTTLVCRLDTWPQPEHRRNHNPIAIYIIMVQLAHVSSFGSNASAQKPFDTSLAELSRLLQRLQQSTLHSDPVRERRLRTSEYERAKLKSVRILHIPYFLDVQTVSADPTRTWTMHDGPLRAWSKMLWLLKRLCAEQKCKATSTTNERSLIFYSRDSRI